jgi:hypothetical protein
MKKNVKVESPHIIRKKENECGRVKNTGLDIGKEGSPKIGIRIP